MLALSKIIGIITASTIILVIYSFREGQFSLDYYANSAPKIVQDNNATRI